MEQKQKQHVKVEGSSIWKATKAPPPLSLHENLHTHSPPPCTVTTTFALKWLHSAIPQMESMPAVSVLNSTLGYVW